MIRRLLGKMVGRSRLPETEFVSFFTLLAAGSSFPFPVSTLLLVVVAAVPAAFSILSGSLMQLPLPTTPVVSSESSPVCRMSHAFFRCRGAVKELVVVVEIAALDDFGGAPPVALAAADVGGAVPVGDDSTDCIVDDGVEGGVGVCAFVTPMALMPAKLVMPRPAGPPPPGIVGDDVAELLLLALIIIGVGVELPLPPPELPAVLLPLLMPPPGSPLFGVPAS